MAASVTESSVTLPPTTSGGSIKPSVHRLPTFEQRHRIEEFIQIRRDMLRYARSFPPGADRNQRRQIALSLRALFKNKVAGRRYMARSNVAH